MSEIDVRRGRACVLAAALLWSIGGFATKLIPLDGPAIAFYRSLFAGLALLPFVPRGAFTLRPAMIPLVATFGVMTGLYIASIKLTTAANAIFLQCTASFWTIPLGYLLLRERPDRRSLAGAALASAGIFAIVGYGFKGTPGEGLGIALGLASGVAYALVIIGLRGFRGMDPIWLSAANNLGGALALGAIVAIAIGPIPAPSPGQALALAVFGVVQMAISYALFARGLRAVGATEAGLLGLLEPILSPIWVYLIVGERPADATLFGGALLLAGVACRYIPLPGGIWSRGRRKTDPPLPQAGARPLQ
jgi:DME family drug/metabolite transporter